MVMGTTAAPDEAPVVGVSPWLLLARDEIRRLEGEALLEAEADGVKYAVHHGGGSLWIVATWASGARVAFLSAYAPGGAVAIEVESRDESSIEVRLDSVVGSSRVRIELPHARRRRLHWRTSIRPTTPLIVPFWPRDVVPLDADGDPLGTKGVVHAAQKGTRAGLIYATITRPEPASFFYVQNLTQLNDYCEATETSPGDRVSGEWPELGFSPPPAAGKALAPGVEVVLSDAHVLAEQDAPDDDLAVARRFLELYAEVYLALDRPEPIYRDWPRRVEETLRTLTHSPECYVEKRGHRYLLAYVGADDRPPESMVQLAVLVPLVEYARSRGLDDLPLIAALRANLPTFFDEDLGTIRRWLPGDEDLLKGREEHMGPDIMDSWYLHHSLMNLSRLALMGDAEARRLFLGSIDYVIKAARRFEYRWPVFYDLRTLEVIKAESAPGRGGENDVGAQFAHLMLQAWDMTGERRFLNEAEAAARPLRGLGFNLGYQFNNTAFGAAALLRLSRETGDPLFAELSLVCLANIVRNFWLWECSYGHAKDYSTYLGLPPLQDAPYLAIYEELEVLAAFHEYLREAGDDVLPAVRVLLPEYCKYVLDRAWYHYPAELPSGALAAKPTSGHLNRQLSIPVEDLADGWSQAGTVGQEVYGAAAPMVFATRHCFEMAGPGLILRCDYPAVLEEMEGGRASGKARLRILGDRRCRCEVRVVADQTTPLPEVRLTVEGRKKPIEARLVEFGGIAFNLPGDAVASLTWKCEGRIRKPRSASKVRPKAETEAKEGAQARTREEAHN
ncbi:hypothetical protein [Paludisphaera soli]|uniref:hypothetical protein n=1 Tax=Paludisphaera soli TaxID=2712865 RepID=UPI0013EBB358|nr:hypothetical protein [Paludisphaera soli]